MRKKMPCTDSNVLGSHIREARKALGLSQEELGRKVGLGKSSISKIESGRTNISFEDASILMEVMGTKLNVMMEFDEHNLKMQSDIMHFSRTCVAWFSVYKGLSMASAFQQMLNSKALVFLKENYKYESTLPKDVIIEDIDRIVNRNSNNVKVS